MLTEKQVKVVRFYRLYSGRKNGTRSVCTGGLNGSREAAARRTVCLAGLPVATASSGRVGRSTPTERVGRSSRQNR